MPDKLPYDFYTLKWCESTEGHQYKEVRFRKAETFADDNDTINDRVHESPYSYNVGENEEGMVACVQNLSEN